MDCGGLTPLSAPRLAEKGWCRALAWPPTLAKAGRTQSGVKPPQSKASRQECRDGNAGGRAAAWKSFGGDDTWKRLKAIPEYADTEIVSHITNMVLTPAPYSEI